MGCDIHLFAEGYTADVRGKTLWNRETGNRRWKNIEHWYRDDVWADLRIQGDGGFSRRDLIDGHRDYGLFYLLAGVRGEEEESSWPPLAKPRGLPEQMDDLVFRYETDEMEIGSIDCHDLSWLTLRELKESGYGGRMPLKGWVREEDYEKMLEFEAAGKPYQLAFIDEKSKETPEAGLVCREWLGYLNLNLTMLISRLEALKEEWRIKSDDEVRIVFWFDN
ncbi:MAG: hypothetical protein ACLTAC_22075 [Hungatella sp.]